MAQDAQADAGAEGGAEIGAGRREVGPRAGGARSRALRAIAWLRGWPARIGISLAATYLFFLEYLPPFQAVGVHSDLSGYHFPLLQYAWQALREGRLPLWDHVIYSGIPFVPIGQHGLFYPPNWLLFGAAALGRGMTYKSLEVLLMLHLCAGFLFCFAWLRGRVKDNLAALAGAAAFAVGGMPLAQIQHVGVVSCYVWIPLALASVERARREDSLRPYLLVAVAAALGFLAGYPPTMLAFVVVLLCWAAAGERPVRHVAAALGALGFALCLGAVQLLPSLATYAGRFREDSYGGGLPHGAFTYVLMFLPNYFDNARPASGVAAWGEYFYLGGAAVLGLACCCAWLYRTRAFGAAAAPLVTVAAALALIGNPGGAVGALVRHWPMLTGVMREYNLLPCITVAACCLAAHGLAWGRAQERESAGRPFMPRRAELAAMALAVVWCVRLVRLWVPGGQEFTPGWGTLADLWCSFMVCLVLLSLSAAGRWRRGAAALFVVVALLELKSFGTNRSFSAEEGHSDKRYRGMRDMRTDGHRMAGMEQAVLEQMLAARHYRVIVMDGLSPLELHYYGLATPQGFEASLPERYRAKVASYVQWRTNRMFEPDPGDERFLRDFAVRYLICRRGGAADGRVAALPHWRALGSGDAFFRSTNMPARSRITAGTEARFPGNGRRSGGCSGWIPNTADASRCWSRGSRDGWPGWTGARRASRIGTTSTRRCRFRADRTGWSSNTGRRGSRRGHGSAWGRWPPCWRRGSGGRAPRVRRAILVRMRRTGDPGDGDELRPVEFWQEEERASRGEIRRHLVRWIAVFAAVAAGLGFTLWWAGSTVRFSAARAQAGGEATWRVYGVVTDAANGEPVPFARISDDAGGAPPHYHSMADHLGHYEHPTLAEKHALEVRALGYRTARVEAGRAWYAWMPAGEQRLDVQLTRE